MLAVAALATLVPVFGVASPIRYKHRYAYGSIVALLTLIGYIANVRGQNANIEADVVKLSLYGRGGAIEHTDPELGRLEIGVEIAVRNDWGAAVTLSQFCFEGMLDIGGQLLESCDLRFSENDHLQSPQRSARVEGFDAKYLHLTLSLSGIPSEQIRLLQAQILRRQAWFRLSPSDREPPLPFPFSYAMVHFLEAGRRPHRAFAAFLDGAASPPVSANNRSAVWYAAGPLNSASQPTPPLRDRDFTRPRPPS